MNTDERFDAELRRIARMGAPGPSISDQVMRRLEQAGADSAEVSAGEPAVPCEPAGPRRNRSRRYRWFIPAAAAAAIVLAIAGFWPFGTATHRGNGIAWAEVVRQFQGARSVRLDMQTFTNGKLDRVERYYLRAPDFCRSDSLDPDGQTVRRSRVAIRNLVTEWNPQTRLYVNSKAHGGGFFPGVADWLQIFDLPGLSRPAQIQGMECSLEHREPFEWQGRSYPRYAVVMRQNGKILPSDISLCLDRRTQEVRLLVVTMKSTTFDQDGRKVAEPEQRFLAAVTLNPDLPDSFFKVPEGYTDVAAGIWPTLSPEVRPVAEAYYAAREKASHYRALIDFVKCEQPAVSYGSGVLRYRLVRNRDRMRFDELIETPEAVEILRKRSFSFHGMWTQMLNARCSSGLLTTGGQLAYMAYERKEEPRAWWVWAPHEALGRCRSRHLTGLGRPAWMDCENRMTGLALGWNIDEPRLKYELLPPDPQRPHLLHIRGTRPPSANPWFEEYWIDPNRGCLCVRQEERSPHHPGGEVWEIREAAQSPEGIWYPKVLHHQSGSIDECFRVEVDATSPIDEHLFDWPKDVQPLAPLESPAMRAP